MTDKAIVEKTNELISKNKKATGLSPVPVASRM